MRSSYAAFAIQTARRDVSFAHLEQTNASSEGFSVLGVAPEITAVLAERKISVPTPIQHSAIPVALKGDDILGIAQTGTGKTFAFGLPLLQRLSQGKGRALIILPTRELALQVEEALQPVARTLRIGIAVFIGGASMHLQRKMLKANPRILIATPGRLIDHLKQKTVTLREVNILVLDEADRMLDMGFQPQIMQILKEVPVDRQTMLFSATMPKEILDITAKHMRTPVHIEIAPAGTAAEKVEQGMLVIRKDERTGMLGEVLRDTSGSVLVFVRTKHGAKKLTKSLQVSGFAAAEIHANRSLGQRKEALEGFKKGKYRVLVATDIAARGIDVAGIELVVNYDLPDNIDEYVHRVGRTGRAGKTGQAISFVLPDQRGDIRRIEKLIRSTLAVAEHPSAKGMGASDRSEEPRRRQSRSPRRGGYRGRR